MTLIFRKPNRFCLIPESVVLVKYFPARLHPYWMMLIFIALILLILFKIPLIILCALNFAAGYLLFIRNYYLFEPYRSPPGN